MDTKMSCYTPLIVVLIIQAVIFPAIYGDCDVNYDSPDTLDSPNYPADYPSNADCYYHITASTNQIVSLVMTDFNTEPGYDYLSVYDSSGPDEEFLINRYSGSILDIPEVLRSSGQHFYLQFESDGSIQRGGFSGDFTFEERPSCNTNYTEPGDLTSPFYPSDYPNNAECGYNITAPDDKIVQIQFKDFNIEHGYDFLSLYDGPDPNSDYLIGIYSGTEIPEFLLSSGPDLFLLFDSDGSNTDTGFAAEFQFVEPVNCNLEYEEPGTISSPYYPANYPNNENCWYNITAPEDMLIELNIIDFAINEDKNGTSLNNCSFDYMSVFDENGEIGTFCGGLSEAPDLIRTSGRYLFVSFKSDGSLTDRGFHASFRFVEPFVCGRTFTEPGIISSPYFPTKYPSNYTCDYTIQAPPGEVVRLSITSFDLEKSPLCSADSLLLFDASDGGHAFFGSYCGTFISRQIQSNGEFLFLRFETNDVEEKSGFNGTFEFVVPDPPVDCGQQTVPLDPEQNIVGGKVAQDGEFPWQAAHLVSVGDDWALTCGASLLNSEWLITAAHCIYSITEAFTNMYMMGSNTWPESSGHEQFGQVGKIFIHPNYSRSAYDWDLALIRLTHPVLATDYVRPVCIPDANMAPLFSTDTMTTITGWGALEETGPFNPELLEVDVPIVDPVICEWLYYPEPITDNMLCAGIQEGGKGTCEGDGGSPMVAKFDEAWYLPGVVSWAEGCAQENAPGVYAKVTAYEDWIEPVLNGGTPIEYTCKGEEFNCFDGWCIYYNTKCNGLYDGCNDGSDEYYCDGYLQIFDAYPYEKLTEASVLETIAAGSEEECAIICLNRRNFTCFAFDFDYDLGACKLADTDFELEPAAGITSMNFHIGTLSESGSLLTSTTGVFSSPKWLSSSYALESLYWLIQSDNKNTRIQITFLVVHEEDTSCSDNPANENDVILRSGLESTSPIAYQYCLGELPVGMPFIVDNSVARVDLNTSDSMSYGFIAEYQIKLTCDKDFTSPNDVTSPNYPQNYPDNSECGYSITAPVNMTVKLTIIRFDIENSAGCTNDYLSIYNSAEEDDSTLIGTYCGDIDNLLDVYRSSEESLFLKFVSDGSINGVGFLGYFTFEPPLCFEQFESPGTISSKNYPNNYPTDITCQYLITAPVGYRVRLIIDDFDVEVTPVCNKDHLILYDRVDDSNEILGLYCGSTDDIPSTFESTERYIYLIFKSDEDVTGRGFSGSFIFIEGSGGPGTGSPPTGNPPACGGQYDTPGTFYSPNYPNNYPNNANCEYTITAPLNKTVVMFIEDFNLESSTGCQYDSFSVYDAPVADESLLIGRYCGDISGIPSYIQSSDRNVFVNFETDGSVARSGFQVSFLFSEPLGPVDCVLNFTEPANLTSPYYPGVYPDDLDCQYSITSPPGTVIRVTVHDFTLEFDPLCEGDFLTAYNGQQADPEQYIATFCGRFVSSQFESSGTSLFLQFKTDDAGGEQGFFLTFEFVEPSEPEPCGMPMPQGPGQTVVGGGDVEAGEWPWMAAHLEYYGFWDYNCGASLINPDLVITAAHCIWSRTEVSFSKIFFGSNKLIEITGTQQFAEIAEIYVHPNYTQDDNEWDVALIKLAHPVLITDYVKPVCIPSMGMEPSFGAGTMASITGWGAGNSTAEGGILDTLKADEIAIVDVEVCKEAYGPEEITESMLCAGERNQGSCWGDDGGPLVSKVEDAWYLAGVVSSPYGCDSLAPGVYGKVTAFEKWIEPALNGERPEEYTCNNNEFQCYNGFCVDYIRKCNGAYDGCLDGSDEIYCYGAYTVFGGFPYLTLDPSSVLATISTPFTDDCGYICLQHANFTCHAFDIDFGNRTCKLAGADYQTVPAETFSTMHFEIIKMPEPGTLFYASYGTFASPNWLPPSPSQTTEYFHWLIMADTEDVSSTEIQFKAIHGIQSPCSNNITISAVRGSVIYDEFELCLKDIEIEVPYVVNGSAIVRVDFATDDPMNFGFIAEYVIRKTCNRYLEEPGTIFSPDYPSAYPNDALCEYVIRAPPNMQIQLVFEEFDIQRGINWESYSQYSSYYFDDLSVYSYIDYWSCPWDYLAIYNAEGEYDGSKIGVYCGDIDDVPEVIQTSGRNMYLKFRSDSVGVVGKGFLASFTFVEPTVCNEILDEPAIVTSPDYPNNYPNNFECGYTISAPEGATVEFVILDFKLQQGTNWDSYSLSSHYYDDLSSSYVPDFPICPYDYLSIYDGPEEDENTLIGVYCGTLEGTPLVVRSSANQLYFKFKSDESITETGFQGFFTFGESVVCGGVYNEPGIIYSTGYPDNYPADLDCAYTLRAPKGYEVRLTMLDFDLEAAEFCTKDVLIVYDAEYADENAYIGTFCGTSISSQFQSTNTSLYLRLRSDGEFEGRGFNARFEFVESVPAYTCGKQTVPLEPEVNVVGGTESQEGEWPWQAAHLVYMNDDWTLNCGATLLTPDWLLTAAHCIYSINNPAADLYLLGTNDIERKSDNHQYAEVEKIYIHPEYSQFGYDFDIALVKLTHPVVITDYVRTICVPDAEMAPDFSAGTQCVTSGWGATFEGGPVENSLMEAEVEITSSESCSEYYHPQPITDNMICAGYAEGGKNPCQGDSGGPLMSKINSTWYLPGVVSWGFGCARENYPGVYAKVTSFAEWIEPIFNGETPQEYECSEDEYQCLDGWCVPYEYKCNGQYDGCNDGSDEMNCDADLIVFDPFVNVQLTSSSVKEILSAEDEYACANLCLYSEGYTCKAFDINHVTKMCSLADATFDVEASQDEAIVHYRMQPLPEPDSILTAASGIIGTPNRLSLSQPGTLDETFVWSINADPDRSGATHLHFITVYGNASTDCTDPASTSEVIIRSGSDETSEIAYQLCLNEIDLDRNYYVDSAKLRIEFTTADSQMYGFLLDYTTTFICIEQYSEPGYITSPMFPASYPNNAYCRYEITAPAGMTIRVEWNIFDIEWAPECSDFESESDRLVVYNGFSPDEAKLIGRYCGSLANVPEMIQSENNKMLIQFVSDANVNQFQGFHLSFTFVETITPTTSATSAPDPVEEYLTWIYVGVGLGAGLLVVGLIIIILMIRNAQSKPKNKERSHSESYEDSEVYHQDIELNENLNRLGVTVSGDTMVVSGTNKPMSSQ